MAPAHGLPATTDTTDSFFDEGVAELGPVSAHAPPAHAWGDAVTATQRIPVQPHLPSGRQAVLGPPQAAELGSDRHSARQAADAARSEPSALSLAQQEQHRAVPAPLHMQHAAAGIQAVRTTQDDDSAVRSAIGPTADSMAAEPARRAWLPAPGSSTDSLRGPTDPLRTAVASQQWATTAALPIDQTREALSSVSDEVSSLHSDAAGTVGPQRPQAPRPVGIAFLGDAAAQDDAAAFEFAAFAPGDEPGSPLAVGSWSTDRGSSVLESFRLPASSMPAGSETGGPPTTAHTIGFRPAGAVEEVDARRPQSQLLSYPPAAVPTTSLPQTRSTASEPAGEAGVSAVRDEGTAQPTGPPSPRPPRSPVRTQDGGPLPSAARTGVAKFRGWQSGKRSAAGATEAPSAQDGTTGRRDRLPPAHSTSLDRWLPPPASEPPQSSADATATASPDVQQTVAGASIPSATVEAPPPDSPGLPSSAFVQHGQPLLVAVASSSAALVVAQSDHADGQPSVISASVVESPEHTSAVSTIPAQPTSESSERHHTESLEGQTYPQSTLAAQLAHSRADAEASRGQLRQRAGELAAMVEQQDVKEAEVAALRRQLEDVQKGAG